MLLAVGGFSSSILQVSGLLLQQQYIIILVAELRSSLPVVATTFTCMYVAVEMM